LAIAFAADPAAGLNCGATQHGQPRAFGVVTPAARPEPTLYPCRPVPADNMTISLAPTPLRSLSHLRPRSEKNRLTWERTPLKGRMVLAPPTQSWRLRPRARRFSTLGIKQRGRVFRPAEIIRQQQRHRVSVLKTRTQRSRARLPSLEKPHGLRAMKVCNGHQPIES
jgi:hypothetical protein